MTRFLPIVACVAALAAFSGSASADRGDCLLGGSLRGPDGRCQELIDGAVPFGIEAAPTRTEDAFDDRTIRPFHAGGFYSDSASAPVGATELDSAGTGFQRYDGDVAFGVSTDAQHRYTDPRRWMILHWRLRWVDFAYVVTSAYLRSGGDHPFGVDAEAPAQGVTLFDGLPGPRDLDYRSELGKFVRKYLSIPPRDSMQASYRCHDHRSDQLTLGFAEPAPLTYIRRTFVPAALRWRVMLSRPLAPGESFSDQPDNWPGPFLHSAHRTLTNPDFWFTAHEDLYDYFLNLRRIYCDVVRRHQYGSSYDSSSPFGLHAVGVDHRRDYDALQITLACPFPDVPLSAASATTLHEPFAGFGLPGQPFVAALFEHCRSHWYSSQLWLGTDRQSEVVVLCAVFGNTYSDSRSSRTGVSFVGGYASGCSRGWPSASLPDDPLAPLRGCDGATNCLGNDHHYEYLDEFVPAMIDAAFPVGFTGPSAADLLPVGVVSLFTCGTAGSFDRASSFPFATPRFFVGWRTDARIAMGYSTDRSGRPASASLPDGVSYARIIQAGMWNESGDNPGLAFPAPDKIPVCYDATTERLAGWTRLFTYPCAGRARGTHTSRTSYNPSQLQRLRDALDRHQTECYAGYSALPADWPHWYPY